MLILEYISTHGTPGWCAARMSARESKGPLPAYEQLCTSCTGVCWPTSFGQLVCTLNIVIKVIRICFICLNMLVNNNDARPKIRSPNLGKNWYPVRITVPANLVFRLEIWGARDNGIPPRSTPDA